MLVVSTDLSHYYDYETALNIDSDSINKILNFDVEEVSKPSFEACGHTAIATVLELAKTNNWQIAKVDYKNSGDTTGEKSRVVGYGAFALFE